MVFVSFVKRPRTRLRGACRRRVYDSFASATTDVDVTERWTRPGPLHLRKPSGGASPLKYRPKSCDRVPSQSRWRETRRPSTEGKLVAHTRIGDYSVPAPEVARESFARRVRRAHGMLRATAHDVREGEQSRLRSRPRDDRIGFHPRRRTVASICGPTC